MIFRHQSYHGNVMMPFLLAFVFLGTRRFFRKSLNPFTARVDDGVCEVVLTLWCDHLNEISWEALSCGVICFKKKFTK